MSFDLGVWRAHDHQTADEARFLYARLCEGKTDKIEAHSAVDAFYQDLIARHPEIDTVPDELIDDIDYCPWSCAHDHSAGHVILSCVWDKADYVSELVHRLAKKHGLVVYDPQTTSITYPNGE